MTSLKEEPDWPWIDEIDENCSDVLMSNCDRKIDQEVAQKLKEHQAVADYTGWNFCCTCWYEDGKYYAAVYRHGVHRNTFDAETPEQLMELVSNRYGWD